MHSGFLAARLPLAFLAVFVVALAGPSARLPGVLTAAAQVWNVDAWVADCEEVQEGGGTHVVCQRFGGNKVAAGQDVPGCAGSSMYVCRNMTLCELAEKALVRDAAGNPIDRSTMGCDKDEDSGEDDDGWDEEDGSGGGSDWVDCGTSIAPSICQRCADEDRKEMSMCEQFRS